MANDGNQDLQQQVLEVLLEKVEQDTFPSVTMMNMIEEILQPEDVPRYAAVLLDKIRADEFPSLDLLKRAKSLT
jgi:hypothetical protein